MKKSILAALGLSVSLALSGAAHAGATSDKNKIERIEVSDTMFAIYPANGGFVNKESCERNDVMVFAVADFPNSHNQLLSIALAAKATDREVTMWLSGCQTTIWGYTVAKPATLVMY